MQTAMPFRQENLETYRNELLVRPNLLGAYREGIKRALHILENPPAPVAAVVPPPTEPIFPAEPDQEGDHGPDEAGDKSDAGQEPDSDAMTARRIPDVVNVVARRIIDLDGAIRPKARDPRQVKHATKEVGQW